MKRILTTLGCCAIFGALAVTTSSAPAAGLRFTRCSNARFSPQYLTVKHIYELGVNCTVAHGVAISYMNAVTQTIGAKGARRGRCFGQHSYGKCSGVRFRQLAYTCFHYGPVPKRTRGLVRCAARGRRVSFNIGT